MPTKKTHLLPCPFCGSKAKVMPYASSLVSNPPTMYVVKCLRKWNSKKARMKYCHVLPSVMEENEADAINIWNTRY